MLHVSNQPPPLAFYTCSRQLRSIRSSAVVKPDMHVGKGSSTSTVPRYTLSLAEKQTALNIHTFVFSSFRYSTSKVETPLSTCNVDSRTLCRLPNTPCWADRRAGPTTLVYIASTVPCLPSQWLHAIHSASLPHFSQLVLYPTPRSLPFFYALGPS